MILVVGATGILGGMITRALLGRGEQVRALVREGSDVEALRAAGAQLVYGDLKHPDTLTDAVRGADVIITTANSSMRGGDDNVETVDRAGNRNLIDAARTAGGVRQFVFVSAIGATMDNPTPFLRAKAETEQHLRESGVTYTIVQPSIFMEIWAGAVVGAPLQAGSPVRLVGEARRMHNFISIGDVAAYVLAAVGNPAAVNQTLLVGGPGNLTWRDVVAAFERATNRPVPLEFLPVGAEVPGLHPAMSALLNAQEFYDGVVEPTDLVRSLGVRGTSIDDFVRGVLPPQG